MDWRTNRIRLLVICLLFSPAGQVFSDEILDQPQRNPSFTKKSENSSIQLTDSPSRQIYRGVIHRTNDDGTFSLFSDTPQAALPDDLKIFKLFGLEVQGKVLSDFVKLEEFYCHEIKRTATPASSDTILVRCYRKSGSELMQELLQLGFAQGTCDTGDRETMLCTQ